MNVMGGDCDQLVGVCTGPPDATEWRRDDGDVIVVLLAHTDAGWWIIAQHVSSDPSWSERDVGWHRDRLDPEHRQPYTWAGWLTQAAMLERFPPATTDR